MTLFKRTLKHSRYVALAACVVASVTSCNLIDTDGPDTVTPAADPPTPSIADGYATLVAIKSVAFQELPGFGQVEVDMGLAVGVFFNGVDYNTYLNAGTVSCEGENLEEQDNGSYVYMPTQTNATGIDYSGKPDWEVSGNADIPAFSHTTTIGFPSVGAISSGSTASASSDYTLTVASVSGADSVIFMIGGVIHTEPGNATSSTFTAAELSSIGNGTTVAQAAAYKIEEANYSGKNFWFVNEKVVTETITIE